MRRKLWWIIPIACIAVLCVTVLLLAWRRDKRLDFLYDMGGDRLAGVEIAGASRPSHLVGGPDANFEPIRLRGKKTIEVFRTLNSKLAALGFRPTYQGGYPSLASNYELVDFSNPELNAEFDWADKMNEVEVQMLTGNDAESVGDEEISRGDILVIVSRHESPLQREIDRALRFIGAKR